MLWRLKAVVAALLTALVVAIVISPVVDLPLTALRSHIHITGNGDALPLDLFAGTDALQNLQNAALATATHGHLELAQSRKLVAITCAFLC